MAAAGLRRFDYLGVCRFGIAQTDVFHDAHVKQVIVLRYKRDFFLVIVQRDLPYIDAAIGYTAAAHVPEGRNQLGDGALAGTGRSHQRVDRTFTDRQVYTVQDFFFLIGEMYILQTDGASVRFLFQPVRTNQLPFFQD